jgi:hypothetical protein
MHSCDTKGYTLSVFVAVKQGTIYKILQIKMVWTCRNDAKPKNAKTNSSICKEGTRKRGRPRKRWKDVVEEDLNVMGIKNGRAAVRDRRKWRKIVFQAKIHNGL